MQKAFAPQDKKDYRQRIIIIALVVVLIILAWQIFSLFFSSNKLASQKPTSTIVKTATSASVQTITPQISTPQLSDLTSDPTQQKYLRLLEEYKVIELQKMIASDKQAIAASQVSIAESLSKINQMGGQTNLKSFNFEDMDTTNISAGPSPKSSTTDYSLVYTGLEDNNWTATIKKDNGTYDVMLGTILNGNYKVTDINNNEVILEGPDKTIHIGFDGTFVTPISVKPQVTPVQSTPATKVITQGVTQIPTLPKTSTPQASTVNSPKQVTPKIIPVTKSISSHPHPSTPWYRSLWEEISSLLNRTHVQAPSHPATHTILIVPQKTPTVLLHTIITPKTVMDLDPTFYTIQLAMLASPKELNTFITHHQFPEHYFIYQEASKKRRFGIIYGIYITKTKAQDSLNQLPDDLTEASPYVVSVKNIQEKVRSSS